MSQKLRVGVIGLGVISKFYLAALRASPSCELVALCDLHPERLSELADEGVIRTTRYKDLLENDQIDAVVVLTPNDTHYEICAAALRAGKHVCCEKPLTLREEEARELAEIARSQNRSLFTAFHRRYNEHFLRLLRSLDPNDMPRFVNARYLERIEEHSGNDGWYLRPERCGGGCIADNGPNVLDCMMELLGELVVSDVAVTENEAGIDIEASISLRSRAQTEVVVLLDWAYPYGECKDITVVTHSGRLHRVDMLEGVTEFKGSLWHEYVGIIEHFAASLDDPKQSERALALVRLIEQIYQRARETLAPIAEQERANAKVGLGAKVVKVLNHRRTERGMKLIEHGSRCVRAGEIHEFVTTDQVSALPGSRIDRVGFLGFGEFQRGGIVERGDRVKIGDRTVGEVIGFDECHYPNHYNIIIGTERLTVANDLDIELGAEISFGERC